MDPGMLSPCMAASSRAGSLCPAQRWPRAWPSSRRRSWRAPGQRSSWGAWPRGSERCSLSRPAREGRPSAPGRARWQGAAPAGPLGPAPAPSWPPPLSPGGGPRAAAAARPAPPPRAGRGPGTGATRAPAGRRESPARGRQNRMWASGRSHPPPARGDGPGHDRVCQAHLQPLIREGAWGPPPGPGGLHGHLQVRP